MPSDQSQTLIEAVKQAAAAAEPLSIRGGNTKAFYGGPQQGNPLDVSGHSGVVSYEPTELVLIDGDARMEAIPGTGLQFVSNTFAAFLTVSGPLWLLWLTAVSVYLLRKGRPEIHR